MGIKKSKKIKILIWGFNFTLISLFFLLFYLPK